jgi:hypothetical protein
MPENLGTEADAAETVSYLDTMSPEIMSASTVKLSLHIHRATEQEARSPTWYLQHN